MSTKLGRTRLRDAAYAAMWSILPAKLDAVLEFLDLRAEGHTLSKRELARRGFSTVALRPGTVEASKGGRVAVLPLNGVIAHHAGFEMQISGGTSTVAFGQAFDAAVNDPNVSAIVIDCDSPGGTVEGVAELFDKIYSARGTKPIRAVVNANCHSAAYWIACAADRIDITPSGSAGNIGVMTVHTDTSAMDEKEGIKRTLIKAGKHKGEGAPFEPLSADAEAALQEQVDEIYGLFVNAVAKGRGVKAAAVKSGFGEGRSLRARQTVDAGLVDGIATLDAVLLEYGASAPQKTNARAGMIALAASEGTCPDCGRELKDGEPFCPECDGPDTDALIPAAAIAAVATVLPELESIVAAEIAPSTLTASTAGPGGSRAVVSLAPNQPTAIQQEFTVTEQEKADALKALRDAENERINAINALCADHGVSLKAAEYITTGKTVEQVMAAILTEKRAVPKKPIASGSSVDVGATRSDFDPTRGFRSPRAWALSVMNNSEATDKDQLKDERLRAIAVPGADGLRFMLPQAYTPTSMLLATQGSDEQSTSFPYGGSTVRPGYNSTLLQLGAEGDPTVGRTTEVPMDEATVEFDARVDKSHVTSVSGGFVWTRKAEAATGGTSRGQFEKVKLEANTLFGAAFATYEILQRSRRSFAAVIESGFREQLGPHMLNEKLRGGGAGEYLGILTALAGSSLGPTISVAKETVGGAQVADTIVTANLLKMRSRCWGYGQAIWMANHDTYPQLATLSVGVGSAGALVYQQSMVEDRPDMLLGRPIFYTEYCNTLGDQGDIVLANWSQYLEGMYSPVQTEESIHARFFANEKAFKFFLSNAGLPWWKSALTPNKSTQTLSPFVVLDAR